MVEGRGPAQFRFGVTDIEALAAGRDGLDATSLLLGKLPERTTPTYVFIVGLVERREERPGSAAAASNMPL